MKNRKFVGLEWNSAKKQSLFYYQNVFSDIFRHNIIIIPDTGGTIIRLFNDDKLTLKALIIKVHHQSNLIAKDTW